MSDLFFRSQKRTAIEAMREFAENFWDEPRKVGCTDGNRFRLVGGVKWYRVEIRMGYWEIVEG